MQLRVYLPIGYICSTFRKFPPPKCFRNNSRSYWRLFDSVRDFCIIPERIDENFLFFGFFFFLSAVVVFLITVIVFFGATALSFILIVVDWEGGTEEEVDDDAEVPTGTILVVEGSRCSASSIDGCCIIGMPFTSLPQDEPAVFADTGVMFVSVVDDGEAAAAAVAGLAEAEAEAAPTATTCGTVLFMAMGGRSVGVSSTELVGDTLGFEDIVMVFPLKYILRVINGRGELVIERTCVVYFFRSRIRIMSDVKYRRFFIT